MNSVPVSSLKLSGNGLCWYLDGWPPQCTTHVSDGFATHASRPKPLSALLNMWTLYQAYTQLCGVQNLWNLAGLSYTKDPTLFHFSYKWEHLAWKHKTENLSYSFNILINKSSASPIPARLQMIFFKVEILLNTNLTLSCENLTKDNWTICGFQGARWCSG